jgi:hypothetical protein
MSAAPVEPFAEDQITLSQAARRLPKLRRDRPVSPSTLWRWYRHGVKAQDGTIVKLRVWRVGGQMLTSEAALREFIARLSGSQNDVPREPAPPTNRARHDVVEAKLDALEIR